MSLLRPTIVLFDMDGTTVRHINPRLLNALERIDDFFYWYSSRKLKHIDIKTPKPRPRATVHRILHKVRRKPVEQIVEPSLGVIEILERLQETGITLAIVSNGLGKGYGHDILERFDLSQFFPVQIFREDFSQPKPHPEPLLKALEALKVDITPQDVIWCIGDRRKDVIAALELQKLIPCQVQPISYGLQAAIAILENHLPPEHILTSYRDLDIILNRVLNQPAPPLP